MTQIRSKFAISRVAGIALIVAAIGMVAAAPPSLVDKRGDVEARATLNNSEIRLSGEVTLTAVISAPGPLTVTPPKTLLTKANLWRARADGLPTREIASDRETWTQIYRLSPLVIGKPEIALGTFDVRTGDGRDLKIDWNGQIMSVDVRTTIESPSTESLRPTTDIESLPQGPGTDRESTSWLFAIIPILLLLSAVGVYIGKRRRVPAIKRDAEWAFNELESADLTADRCAAVLRQYVSYRFGLPVDARTTPELASALKTDGRLRVELVDEWQLLLDDCDVVRFSGIVGELSGLADRARILINSAEEDFKAESRQSTPTS